MPKMRCPVFFRLALCAVSHQKFQYSFHVAGMSLSFSPASFSMSIQYWTCMVCCFIG